MPIVRDRFEGANTVSSERSRVASLDASISRRLLQPSSARRRASVEILLLTALGRSVSRLTGGNRVRVALEGHGREDLFADVDLSRSVGWFTAMYPLCLELSSGAGLDQSIDEVEQQLGAVPERGIGYGLLRYLGPESKERAELAAQPAPEISFNYLGQFDQVVRSDGLFTGAGESTGAMRSHDGKRAHLLDVVVMVSGGCVHVVVTYSEALHSASTVEGLLEGMLADLREMAQEGAARTPQGVGGAPPR
jgi:non-ribosomal peptide synthase protein (TIGR01720 family)